MTPTLADWHRPPRLAARAGVAALGLLVVWAGLAVVRRRLALNAFDEGAAAYYAGDDSRAEAALRRSLARRGDARVASFLSGLLIQRSLKLLSEARRPEAARALAEAAALSPGDAGLARTAAALMDPAAQEAFSLDGLAASTVDPRRDPHPGPPPLRGAGNGDSVRQTERALERGLWAAVALLALLVIGFAAAAAALAWALFGPRGYVARVLEHRAAAPFAGLLAAEKEIEAIEAEFTRSPSPPMAAELLEPFLDDPDPRVRARAAAALFRRAPDRLQALLSSADKGVQAAAVRALVRLKADAELDPEERERAARLLAKARENWIV